MSRIKEPGEYISAGDLAVDIEHVSRSEYGRICGFGWITDEVGKRWPGIWACDTGRIFCGVENEDWIVVGPRPTTKVIGLIFSDLTIRVFDVPPIYDAKFKTREGSRGLYQERELWDQAKIHRNDVKMPPHYRRAIADFLEATGGQLHDLEMLESMVKDGGQIKTGPT